MTIISTSERVSDSSTNNPSYHFITKNIAGKSCFKISMIDLKKNRRKERQKKERRKTLSPEGLEIKKSHNPVINLSSYIYTESQISVLAKGLGFSPTNRFNVFDTLMDVNKFARLLFFFFFFKNDLSMAAEQSNVSPTLTEENARDNNLKLTFTELCSLVHLRSLESESEPLLIQAD